MSVVEVEIWEAWASASRSLRRARMRSSRVVRVFWAAISAGEVRLVVWVGCLRIGVGVAGMVDGALESVNCAASSVGGMAVILCASLLGWYVGLVGFNGVPSPFRALRGDTNGLAKVLVLSLSLRRFTVSGEGIVLELLRCWGIVELEYPARVLGRRVFGGAVTPLQMTQSSVLCLAGLPLRETDIRMSHTLWPR